MARVRERWGFSVDRSSPAPPAARRRMPPFFHRLDEMPGSGAGADWLRHKGAGKRKAGRAPRSNSRSPDLLFSLETKEQRGHFVLILLARLRLEMARPKHRKPFRSPPPSLQPFDKKPPRRKTACARLIGGPCMELGRYSGTMENVAAARFQEGFADGKPRHFHAMPHGAQNIWGVTAGTLRNLHERLYS